MLSKRRHASRPDSHASSKEAWIRLGDGSIPYKVVYQEDYRATSGRSGRSSRLAEAVDGRELKDSTVRCQVVLHPVPQTPRLSLVGRAVKVRELRSRLSEGIGRSKGRHPWQYCETWDKALGSRNTQGSIVETPHLPSCSRLAALQIFSRAVRVN